MSKLSKRVEKLEEKATNLDMEKLFRMVSHQFHIIFRLELRIKELEDKS